MNIKSNSYKEPLFHFYNIMVAMNMPNGFVRNNKYNHTTILGISAPMTQKTSY